MLFVNKLKVLTLMTCLVLVGPAFAAWDGVTKTRPSQDAKKVFIITNEAELAWFADTTNIKTGTGDQQFVVSARLESNLDMGNKYFTPICGGKGDKKFQGIFDGQQHVIRNVKYDGEELIERYNDERYGQNVGFVGAMSGGTVKNLIIENLNIHSSTNILEDGKENQISVGGIVGWMQNGTIDNCVTSGSIFTSGKGQGVGGIAGALWQGTISNCLSYVGIQVSGQDAQIGGIVGLTKKGTTVTIKSCVYAGTTLVNTGNGAVGGIVGQQKENGSLNIDDCFYDTDVVTKGVDKIKDSTKVTNNSHGVSDVNDGKSMCEANDGNWGVCSVANHNDETSCLQNEGVWYADSCSKEGAWSTGENSVSLNGYGADGYKITFDANGGFFPANAKKVKFLAAGVQITADEITMPYHTGAWAFAGWALTNDENAVPTANLGVVSKAKTIYAVWKPVYTITFDANPGVFPAVEGFAESATRTKSVAQGERITVEGIGDLPTRYCSDQGENGCNLYLYFTGWAYESIVLGEEDEPDDYTLDLKTIDVEGSVNLKAVWTAVETYTVTFDANSHGKTKVSYVKVGKGERLTKKLDPEADDGYVFGGWCLNEAPCENTFDFDTTTITQSINLVAAWSLDTFDIIYETDGGSNPEDNKVKYTVETESFSFSAPTRDGYDFDNWFYNYEDGVYSNKATQITKGTTGDKTLYAKWNKKKYIITYLAGNDGRGTINPDTLFHGGAITLKNSGDFTRKGYEQTAWITENAAQTFNLGAEYSANAAITLYPKWKIIDYNITYILNAENATNNKDNKKTYRVNQNVSLKDPARPGYTFGGWFDNEDLSGEPVTMIKQGSTGDKTFYAKWIPGTYTVTYDAGEFGEGSIENGTKTHDVDFELSTEKFTRSGYTQDGWMTTEDGAAVEFVFGATYTENAPLTLYPHWVESCDSTKIGAVTIYTYATDGRKEAVMDGEYGSSENTDEVQFPNDVFTDPEGLEVSKITLNRKFTIGTMSTIMLPFTIDVNNVHGGVFYRFKRVDIVNGERKVIIGKVKTSSIGANTPYMFMPEEEEMTFDGSVTLNTTTDPSETLITEDGNWEFKGTYKYIKFNGSDNVFGFAGQARSGAKVGQFVQNGGNGADILSMRAYLENYESNSMLKSNRMMKRATFGLPTEIDVEIENEEGTTVAKGKLNTITGDLRIEGWFDLNGRRLNAKPTVQGNYYHKGKRVIVK